MAAIDTALAQYLSADATTLGMVHGRVYPLLAPQQAALPFLVYSEVAYRPVYHMRGSASLQACTYQIDAYAERHQQARDLAEAVVAAMHACNGLHNGLDFRVAFISDRRVSFEASQAGEQHGVARVSVDTELWYLG
jgi:hypothetical protein